MKKNIVFALVVMLILFGLFHLSKNEPKPVIWNRSYRTADPQPYGGEVLDKLLAASWKEGYSHSYKRVGKLLADSLLQDKNLLILCDNLYMPHSEIKALIEYLEAGGNALIVSQYFDSNWNDVWNTIVQSSNEALGININQLENSLLKMEVPTEAVAFHHAAGNDSLRGIPLPFIPFYFSSIEKLDDTEIDSLLIEKGIEFESIFLGEEIEFDSIVLYEDLMEEDEAEYIEWEEDYEEVLQVDYPVFTVASNRENKPIILRYAVGKGNLILSCSPLLYTNYSLLNDTINPFFEQSMAYLKGKPLIRTEYYKVGSQESEEGGRNQSIFRVLTDNPSSRWAYYLFWVGIILFMVFTAKRKQKVIPIITPPKNRILDFIDSIVGLYLSRNNNADILQKRYIYWAEEMHKKYGIDIINEEHTPAFYSRFAAKTKTDASEARYLILTLESMKLQPHISDKELMDIITTLNKF